MVRRRGPKSSRHVGPGQNGRVRTPLALLSLLALTACSSGSSGDGDQSLRATSAPTTTQSVPSATSSAAARATKPGGTATAAAATGTTASVAPAKPLTTAAPGKPAASKATAAGVYTYDSTGTVTLGEPGTPQDASGTATLTVSSVKDGRQHLTLHNERSDTEQDLLVRDTGTYGASLKLTSPAFTKEFRPSPAVLIAPDPAAVGTSWSWSGRSTDGKTTVTAGNKVVRTETLTIGGVRVACVVLQTHLVLTGDLDYTADITTWWAPSYRLAVKDRTVGKGSYNDFPFSTDITGVLRSVTPS